MAQNKPDSLRTVENNKQTEASQPPIGIAGLACLICLAVIYFVANPVVSWLEVWWAAVLIYSVIPISVAFTILYRSPWHREFAKPKRIFSMILSSCLIFCISFAVLGLIVALSAMFTGFGEGH
jgi:hypothetical protein